MMKTRFGCRCKSLRSSTCCHVRGLLGQLTANQWLSTDSKSAGREIPFKLFRLTQTLGVLP